MCTTDLQSLYAEYESWEDVAAHLVLQLEESETDDDQAILLRALAHVHADHLGDPAGAAEILEKLLELVDGERADLETLASCYEATGDWESVASLLLELLGLLEAPDERAATLRRAAAVYERELSQIEGAQLVLQKALVETPEDEGLWAQAERVWRASGDLEGLVTVLASASAALATAKGEDATTPIAFRIAAVHLELDRPELAEAYLARIIAHDEKNEDALRELQAIYARTEEWDSLAEVAEKRAAMALDTEVEAAAHRVVGQTARDHLGDPDRAIRHFSRAYQLERRADDAAMLASLYQAAGRSHELVVLLEARLATAESNTETADLNFGIGTVYRDSLEDLGAAANAFAVAVAADPAHENARAALSAMLVEDEDWGAYIEHLESWQAAATDDEMRAKLTAERARVLENELDDIEGAIRAFEQLRFIDETAHDCLPNLLRIFEQLERFEDTVTTHMRIAELTEDNDVWRHHVMSAAAIYRTRLERPRDALETYNAVLGALPSDAEALVAVEQIQLELGDTAGAIGAIESRIALTTDPEEAARLTIELARLQRLTDPETAVRTLEAVYETLPDADDVTPLLEELYEVTERWSALLTLLLSHVDDERDMQARAALLARIGHIQLDHLDDADSARGSFETAYELDPEQVSAARPLADMYLAEEAWERARPLLRMLVEHTTEHDSAEAAHSLHRNLAVADELLGFHDEAVAHYERALAADPDDTDSLLALSRLYVRTERAVDADNAFIRLLREHLESFDEDTRVQLFFDAGQAALAAGDEARARTTFQRALAIDEYHEPTLKALAGETGAVETPGEQLEARQALLQVTDDPVERLKLLLKIGNGFREVGDAPAAIEAYEAALELEPDSKVLLHKLLDTHSGEGRWEQAVAILVRLADLEEDEARRNKLLFTVGAIYRDQLDDRDRAIEVFEQLLDIDSGQLEAFEAIDRMCVGAKDWEGLEAAYLQMIERVAEDTNDTADALRFQLFKNLAQIYRDRLDRPGDAITAFVLASRYDPNSLEVLEAIADIYPPEGKDDDDVIAQHRALVRVKPDREDSHHLLLQALKRQRRFDEAWTTASILVVLGNREKTPTEFYREHRPASVPLASRGLSRAELRMLQHPDLSQEATRLLAVIAGTLRRVYSQDLKHFGLNRRRDWIDVSQPSAVTNLFHYAAQVLGVAMPALYRTDGGRGFENANTELRSVLIGDDVIDSASDRRLVYRAVRATCLLRNEYYLASALTQKTLRTLVQACLSLYTGTMHAGWDTEAIQAWHTEIRREPDEILSTLGEAVHEYMSTGQPLNLKDWPRAVEHSANRAALLLCGDLVRAMEAVNDLPHVVGGVDAHDIANDLIRFAGSTDYVHVRAELHLGIGQQ